MYGNIHDVLSATQTHVSKKIDLATREFSPSQRDMAMAVVGKSMAELIWKSDTNPNGEKKWGLPDVAQEIANRIVSTATRVAHDPHITEDQFKAFVTSPELRKIAEATKIETLNYLDQLARGR